MVGDKDENDETQGTSEQTLLLTLLSEVTNELRSRRDPEHLYTAAAIGGFGAVTWGCSHPGNGHSHSRQ
jgi:hypothetical protein